MMELVLALSIGILFAFAYVIEKVTELVKQLKSSNSVNLGKGFKAQLTVTPIHKKSEEDAEIINSSPKQ